MLTLINTGIFIGIMSGVHYKEDFAYKKSLTGNHYINIRNIYENGKE